MQKERCKDETATRFCTLFLPSRTAASSVHEALRGSEMKKKKRTSLIQFDQQRLKKLHSGGFKASIFDFFFFFRFRAACLRVFGPSPGCPTRCSAAAALLPLLPGRESCLRRSIAPPARVHLRRCFVLLSSSGSHRAARVNLISGFVFFPLSPLFPLRQTSEQTSDPLVPSAASFFFSLLLLLFFFYLTAPTLVWGRRPDGRGLLQ